MFHSLGNQIAIIPLGKGHKYAPYPVKIRVARRASSHYRQEAQSFAPTFCRAFIQISYYSIVFNRLWFITLVLYYLCSCGRHRITIEHKMTPEKSDFSWGSSKADC